jgi:CBS domain-containing protein
MESKIYDVMTRHVIPVDMEDTVEKVEHILNSNKLNSVPVIDSAGSSLKNECFGIISSPDLVRFHELKKNAKAVHAWEICTYKPIEVSPDLTVSDAAQIMISHGIHHLIVTENKSIKGFVSSLDLLKELLIKERPH